MKYDIDIDSYIGYPISKGYIKAKIAPIKGRPITVRINSYGGDVQTALDIRQQFIDHGDVSAYIFGMTASAATMLAMGAKKIYMSRYALMLIHCSSTFVTEWDGMNAEDLKRHIADHNKTLEDLKTIDDIIASLYCRRNGRTLDEMKAVMKEEKWLTAERCKELGLIDEIIEEGKQLPAATAAVRERFAACGLPVPDELSAAADRSILARIRRLVSADTAAEEPEHATDAPAENPDGDTEGTLPEEAGTVEAAADAAAFARELAAARKFISDNLARLEGDGLDEKRRLDILDRTQERIGFVQSAGGTFKPDYADRLRAAGLQPATPCPMP